MAHFSRCGFLTCLQVFSDRFKHSTCGYMCLTRLLGFSASHVCTILCSSKKCRVSDTCRVVRIAHVCTFGVPVWVSSPTGLSMTLCSQQVCRAGSSMSTGGVLSHSFMSQPHLSVLQSYVPICTCLVCLHGFWTGQGCISLL